MSNFTDLDPSNHIPEDLATTNWDNANRPQIVKDFQTTHVQFKNFHTVTAPNVHVAESWGLALNLIFINPTTTALCDSLTSIINAKKYQKVSMRRRFRMASRQAAKVASNSNKTDCIHKIKSHADGLKHTQLVHSLADYAASEDASEHPTIQQEYLEGLVLPYGEERFLIQIRDKFVLKKLSQTIKDEDNTMRVKD